MNPNRIKRIVNMKLHKYFALFFMLSGLAAQGRAAVFVLPTEIHHFSPMRFSRGADADRTNTWEPPHIILTNVTSADHPVWIANAGDGSDRLFIVQQSGTVVIVGKDTPFLDLRTNVVIVTPINSPPSSPQTKMVSIAFPPDYAQKGYFYVSYYTWDGTFKVSRFHVSTTNSDVAVPDSEEVIGSNYPLGCGNAGQLVFAPDGTLFLNLAGPVANAGDLAALSGKMLALLNESGRLLPTNSETSWPFSQYFDATDCSEIGGAFAENSGNRMNGVYFYSDGNGTIWGLKFNGTNWAKYDLASPTASVWLPTDPLPGSYLPANPNPGSGLTNTFPIPTNGSPIVPTGPITPITAGGTNFFSNSSITANTASSAPASEPATSTSIPRTPVIIQTTQQADSQPQHPIIISAFGLDEKGRLYVVDYGSAYWTQGGPPNYTPVEKFAGGGIYQIQDDLLQFTVRQIIHGHQVTLEWQSAPGVRYRIQESVNLHRWFNVRPEMTGNGWVLSVSNLPLNSRIFYRVTVITPIRT